MPEKYPKSYHCAECLPLAELLDRHFQNQPLQKSELETVFEYRDFVVGMPPWVYEILQDQYEFGRRLTEEQFKSVRPYLTHEKNVSLQGLHSFDLKQTLKEVEKKVAVHGGQPKKWDRYCGKFFEESVLTRHKELLRPVLQNQRVIEIGPGTWPQAEALYKLFGIKEYACVDVYANDAAEILAVENLPINIEVVQGNALNFLSQQQDNSAIIISCAVSDVLSWHMRNAYHYDPFCKANLPCGRPGELRDDYWHFMAKEIHRVTPLSAVTLHTWFGRTLNYGVYGNDHDVVFGRLFEPRCMPNDNIAVYAKA